MSKIGELVLNVQDAIAEGELSFDEIAAKFNIPVEDVNIIAQEYNEQDEYDPFLSDAEADADALASAGWGSDEDYVIDNDYFDDY